MNMQEAMRQRHSVREYESRPLEENIVKALTEKIKDCNQRSGLNIQLVRNEPKAFSSFLAHYGKFRGVENYIAMVGKKGRNLHEMCGYYGEELVLEAQRLGLNTCWVALTFKKVPGAFRLRKDETLAIVIALGYGKTAGVPHKSKTFEDVTTGDEDAEWFRQGVEAALLAPTAVNQQKFTFSCKDGKVSVKAGIGFYAKIDLGIVKYHFELGSGRTLEKPWE